MNKSASTILSRDIRDEWYLIAFDKKTGESLWKADLPNLNKPWGTNWATPVIYKDQIVLHRTGELAGYNVENGKRLWWFQYLSSGTSTPVIDNDMIYVGTWHNYSESDQRANFPQYHDFTNLLDDFDTNNDSLIQKTELPDSLYAYVRPEILGVETADGNIKKFFGLFDEDEDNNIKKAEWDAIVSWITNDFYKEAGMVAIKPEAKGELTLKNVVWRELEKVPEVPSPIVYNNLAYMCKNGGILTCMDALNGTVVYRERIGASGPYFASPVAAGDYIYIPSGNGVITVIRADKKLEIVLKNDFNEKIFATPAIIGNNIYVRTIDYLYAFGQN